MTRTFTYEFSNGQKAIVQYGANDTTYISYTGDPKKIGSLGREEQIKFQDALRTEKLSNEPDESTKRIDAVISRMSPEERRSKTYKELQGFGALKSDSIPLVTDNGNTVLEAADVARELGVDLEKIKKDTRRIIATAAKTGKVSKEDANRFGLPLNVRVMLALLDEGTLAGVPDELFSQMNAIVAREAGYKIPDDKFLETYNCSFAINIANVLYAKALGKTFKLPANGDLNYATTYLPDSMKPVAKGSKLKSGMVLSFDSFNHVGILFKDTAGLYKILSMNNQIGDGKRIDKLVLATSVPKNRHPAVAYSLL